MTDQTTTPAPPDAPAPSEQPANETPTTIDEFFEQAKQYGGTSKPLSSHQAWQQAYPKPEPEPAAQGLTSDELQEMDLHGAVNELYLQIGSVFQENRVNVEPTDPEWRIIQAELEDPFGSLTRTLIAAGEAAQAKKKRLQQPMSSNEAWEQAYKR